MSGPADLVDSSPYAVERDLVARAVPARRDELFTGRRWPGPRWVRSAWRRGRSVAGPIARPTGPTGVLGSITHTDGLCSVVVVKPTPEPAVGRTTGASSASGLDAEVDARLDDAVADGWSPRRSSAPARPAHGRRRGRRVLGEGGVFKALNPATGVWLELDDVEVVLGRDDELATGETDGGWFTVAGVDAATCRGCAPSDVSGRWSRFGAWVLAGAVATLTRP